MKQNTPQWHYSLSHAVTCLQTLCDLLDITINDMTHLQPIEKSFAFRVPREFVARMEKRNPRDPLLLQVLPQMAESLPGESFSTDPLHELQQNPVPGILHKYSGRVLLTLTGACAIHCRYCFRRHFPYESNFPGQENWQKILNYIADHPTIEEVILSGGDPLLLSDKKLAECVSQLENISHVERLRIHTRLPVVIPSRVTDDWVAWMKQSRLLIIVVLHINHPNEIDDAVILACKHLKTANITLLNQSVLLKNINDCADTLIQLSKKLFQAGVLPYYLHLLDKVQGAAHFDVDETTAEALMSVIKAQLPGFLVPKLAREVAGHPNKRY